VRICRGLIAREGWKVAGIYADHATSGATDRRPDLQRLRTDADAGKFDVVVAEALDRLSRDQEHIAGLYKRLGFAGIRIVTVAEGAITELHIGLKGTMNAVFLKDLAAKTHRGLRGRVESGHSAGGRAYGYRVVKEHEANGEPIRGQRAIEPTEAKIVERIFREFAAGKSPKAIARSLNAEKIPGPNGGIWQDSTIRGHAARRTGILRNDLYVGRIVWNRQRYMKNPATGKRIARPNPPSEWIVEELPELRIIDETLWNRVQTQLDEIRCAPVSAKVRGSRFWERRRPRHLVSGLVHCGTCGAGMMAVGRDLLRCRRAQHDAGCTNRLYVKRGEIEALILDAVRHNLMRPRYMEAFARAYVEEANRLHAERSASASAIESELREVTKKLDQLVDAIASGFRSSSLQARLDELERRKADLTARLQSETPTPVRLHPNLAQLYRQRVEALHEALKDPASSTEAIGTLRSLITRIDVHSGTPPEIELTGDIASMVAVAMGEDAGKRLRPLVTGDVSEAFAKSVKVVAGTGFEPVTFRL
jgi:site-specific DNA recombinase